MKRRKRELGLKCRMIEPVSQYLRITRETKNGLGSHSESIIDFEYPLDMDISELGGFEAIRKKYGKDVISFGLHKKYNTESGKPEPGDMFWFHSSIGSFDWDNQEGPELHVILPNGIEWNIDSRAINCNRKNDRFHRCWIRTGEPPKVTVGKGQKGDNTCSAGAGSIKAGDYHGFLINGHFTKNR